MKSHHERLLTAAANIGCMACRGQGLHTPNVEIHHIVGRERQGGHILILPLCTHHHQTGPNAIHSLLNGKAGSRGFRRVHGHEFDMFLALRDLLIAQNEWPLPCEQEFADYYSRYAPYSFRIALERRYERQGAL